MSNDKTTKQSKVSKTKQQRIKQIVAAAGLVGLSFLAFNGAQAYIQEGRIKEAFAGGVVAAFLYMILGVFL